MLNNKTTDLIETCLRAFHGNGHYGWGLLKQQWPEAAVAEQRRKMAEVIVLAQNATDAAAEPKASNPRAPPAPELRQTANPCDV